MSSRSITKWVYQMFHLYFQIQILPRKLFKLHLLIPPFDWYRSKKAYMNVLPGDNIQI